MTPTPPDLAAREHALALRDLKASELDRVRKVAGKWQAALGGVVGVLTTVLVIKGPASVEELADWAKVTVALLLLGALVSGMIALILAIYAANGLPRSLSSTSAADLLLDLDDRAQGSVSALRGAIVLSVATAILLCTALVISWFAQKGPVIWIEKVNGQIECGKLAVADGERIVIEQGDRRVAVNLRQVASFEIRDSCVSVSG